MAEMARRRGYWVCVDVAATIDRDGFRPLFGGGRRGLPVCHLRFCVRGAIQLLGLAIRRSDIW